MKSNAYIDRLCETLNGVQKDTTELDKKLEKMFKYKYKKCESMNFFAGMLDIAMIILIIMVWGAGIISHIVGKPVTIYALEGVWYGELICIALLGTLCLAIAKCLYNNKVVNKSLKPTFSQKVFGLYRVDDRNVWINPFGKNSRTAFMILLMANLIALGSLFKGGRLEWGSKGIENYLYMYPTLNVVVSLVTIAAVLTGIYLFSRGKLKGIVFMIVGNIIGIFNIYNICNNIRMEKMGLYTFGFSIVVTIIVSLYYYMNMKNS